MSAQASLHFALESLENLATCYEKTGRDAEAKPLREEAAQRKAEREKKATPKTSDPAKEKPAVPEDE